MSDIQVDISEGEPIAVSLDAAGFIQHAERHAEGASDELSTENLAGAASNITTHPLANDELENAEVTVAGQTVSLGSSTSVAYGDLSDTGTFPIGDGDLATDYVEVAGDTVTGDLNLDGNRLDNATLLSLADRGGDGTKFLFIERSSDGRFAIREDNTAVDIFRADESGDIEIPSGDLDLDGNGFLGPSVITAGDGLLDIQTDGAGSSAVALRDKANGQRLLVANEGGPVSVPNTGLEVPSEYISLGSDPSTAGALRLSNSSTIEVRNAANDSNFDVLSFNDFDDIEIGASSVRFVNIATELALQSDLRGFKSDFLLKTAGGGSDSISLYDDANNQDLLVANEGGPVEVPNTELQVGQDIDLNGNVLKDIGNQTGSAFVDARPPVPSTPSSGVNANDSPQVLLAGRQRDSTGAIEDFASRIFSVPDTNALGDGKLAVEVQGTRGLNVNHDGTVEVPNGDLDFTGPTPIVRGVSRYKLESNTDFYTNGSGGIIAFDSNAFNVYDKTNSQYVAQFQEGGNVEIPNGQTILQQGTESAPALTFDGDESTGLYNYVGSELAFSVNGTRVARFNEFGSLNFEGSTLFNAADYRGTSSGPMRMRPNQYASDDTAYPFEVETIDSTSDVRVTGLRVVPDGANANVKVPSGDLNIDGNTLLNAGRINAGDTDLDIHTLGGGSDRVSVYDEANGQFIAKLNEGGNVEIPNGRLRISNEAYYEGDRVRTAAIGAWSVYDQANEQDIARFNEGGNVEIPNGWLSLSVGLDAVGAGAGDFIEVYNGYDFYSEDSGTNGIGTTRFWIDAPDQGHLTFGPRNGEHRATATFIRTDLRVQGGHAEVSDGVKYQKRSTDPSTSELASGQVMTFVSDGSSDVTGSAGDLIYAINDGGTIKTQTIAAASNAT